MRSTLLFSLTTISPLAASNAVIFSNATLYGGHADNGISVQGSLYGSDYESNQMTGAVTYIGGDNNLNGNIGLRANTGTYRIVGSLGKASGNVDATMPVPDFSYYAGLSGTYAALAGATADFSDMNTVSLQLSQALNVFTLQANQLAGVKTINFTGGGKVILNIHGTPSSSWGYSVNGVSPGNMIWNFVDATSVTIANRSLTGSLIAEHATVYQYQNIDGTLIANNWSNFNNAELHGYELPTITVIPEPSVISLGAVAMLFLLRRRECRP